MEPGKLKYAIIVLIVCSTVGGMLSLFFQRFISFSAPSQPVAVIAAPPPDFSRYSLTPQRTFEVITNGYPGTTMASNAALPEEIRRGLVAYLQTMLRD